jgi:hypothetical protein
MVPIASMQGRERNPNVLGGPSHAETLGKSMLDMAQPFLIGPATPTLQLDPRLKVATVKGAGLLHPPRRDLGGQPARYLNGIDALEDLNYFLHCAFFVRGQGDLRSVLTSVVGELCFHLDAQGFELLPVVVVEGMGYGVDVLLIERIAARGWGRVVMVLLGAVGLGCTYNRATTATLRTPIDASLAV